MPQSAHETIRRSFTPSGSVRQVLCFPRSFEVSGPFLRKFREVSRGFLEGQRNVLFTVFGLFTACSNQDRPNFGSAMLSEQRQESDFWAAR